MNNDNVTFFKPLRTALIALCVLGSVFLAVLTITSARSWTADIQRPINSSISVNGKGEAIAVPDVANFTFTVNESGANVSVAQDKVTKKIKLALEALKKLGIEDKDIKTLSYNANPKYDYAPTECLNLRCVPRKQILTGYEVSESIEVKIRNVDKAGATLTAIGAVNTQYVSGLSFVVDDVEKVNSEAREKAVADAKMKAEKLAQSLGVKLGRITGYYEDLSSMYGGGMYGMGEKSAVAPQAAQVPTGENKYSSSVSITYEIR